MQRHEEPRQAVPRSCPVLGQHGPKRQRPRVCRGELLASALGKGIFAPAYFEPVSTVDGLDVEDLAARDSEHALDRCRDVFVHSVRKLDDDDRALSRSSDQTTGHRT